MNAFSDFDPDEQALVKKPKPIGWFFAGLATLAAAVTALGYYFPLSSAHETLVAEHEKLATKSSELDHALKTSTSSHRDSEKRRNALRHFLDEGLAKEESQKVGLEIARATAENQLKKYIKAKLVSLKMLDSTITFSLSDKLLFRGKTSSTTGRTRRPLCAAASALGTQKEWSVTLRTRAPQGDKKYWETAGERSAKLAVLLERSCKISKEQITITSERPSDPKSPAFGITDIIVGPRLPPKLDLSKAPKPKGASPKTDADEQEKPEGTPAEE